MFSDQDRIELTQTFKSFRFADGAAIDDAGNWLRWGDNSKLCDILKHVYPKSEAMSDVARILSIAFKIFWAKNPRHFLTFLAQVQHVLGWEDRQEEFMALSASAYTLLQDALIDQVIGKLQENCAVTKDFVNCIKARAPTNMEELFAAIVCEGEALHKFALRAELMLIPKITKKDDKDIKDQKSKDSKIVGGGGARKSCSNCGKYHDGLCTGESSCDCRWSWPSSETYKSPDADCRCKQ
jgi:hypothetical protein